ncbi:DUF2254 domain-containing protein [Williamsia maris]|uniref:Membrane protein n=1 Tax=Williamsia maris TaxID=72806 RepID=A0ABT1H9Z6_9NOCA|nr:DUF2254 family protein [Williamsia maris]MCP2174560.1 putative membrane protein [Williamsia maris]
MSHWFTERFIDTGRLPIFFLLVAFVLTFLFIRFSVRMIRAQVSWWPGNVTPGGMHIHHVIFGLVFMLLSGFGLVVLSDEQTPVANCVLAAVFGIGTALVLDEFALVLHLRDVYWAEEGRSSIDAVFVAVAIVSLFLFGIRPIGFDGDVGELREDHSIAAIVATSIWLAVELGLAVITVLKGKLWTGLVGLFIVPLLIVGAIRLSRPAAPWARWRYARNPGKRSRSLAREERFREPMVRAKIVVQESISGSFGLPEVTTPASVGTPPPIPALDDSTPRPPHRLATAIAWQRTRRRLRPVPIWRLPLTLVALAVIASVALDTADDQFTVDGIDGGALATLLSVIAGAMITLTALVFTAITLAMQFGATQISVRVIPMLQQDRTMRASIGVFLATFVFALGIALEIAIGGQPGTDKVEAPLVSTAIAMILTLISAVMFVMLVAKVGNVLNSERLLRWIAAEGHRAILRRYPEAPADTEPHEPPADTAAPPESSVDVDAAGVIVVRLRQVPAHGRVLLAIDLARIQRLATRWEVSVAIVPAIGDFVPHDSPVFEVRGTPSGLAPHQHPAHQLQGTLIFGDTHQPSVSPVAALQSIVDVASKALSTSVNNPGLAVQALNHLEDLLLVLAPRLRADTAATAFSRITGYQRSWTDYVSIATDEIRQFCGGSIQVQRRLRGLLTTLIDNCPESQHPPLTERLAALDIRSTTEWDSPLDRRLASASDSQGLGSESGNRRGPAVAHPSSDCITPAASANLLGSELP